MSHRSILISAVFVSLLPFCLVTAQETEEQRSTHSQAGDSKRDLQDPSARGQYRKGEGAAAAPEMNIKRRGEAFTTDQQSEGITDWYDENDPGVYSEEGAADTGSEEKR